MYEVGSYKCTIPSSNFGREAEFNSIETENNDRNACKMKTRGNERRSTYGEEKEESDRGEDRERERSQSTNGEEEEEERERRSAVGTNTAQPHTQKGGKKDSDTRRREGKKGGRGAGD